MFLKFARYAVVSAKYPRCAAIHTTGTKTRNANHQRYRSSYLPSTYSMRENRPEYAKTAQSAIHIRIRTYFEVT